ncbi:RNA methyltransferase [Flavobacteriaceae bacterium]|nr:RNA methyltransferase [Flavobacteriaceae bacterium]
MKLIQSTKNPELKQLRLLFEKARERKKKKLFVIEGEREIKKAILSDYSFTQIFMEDGSAPVEPEVQTLALHTPAFRVERKAFERISKRSGSEKIMAVAQIKSHELGDLTLTDQALVLVIEAPEKPGNIGALFRTAAAAKMDAVIIANPKTDFYNPNSIRSSLGSIFLLPSALAPSSEVISYLNTKSFAIVAAAIEPNAIPYDQYKYNTPCALVLGTESTGLEANWLQAAHQSLIIPMAKTVDSLNLSVSAGILMYEAQRKNKRLE